MEKDLILRQFEKIEDKVEGLIAERRLLEVTNRELHDKIRHLEAELQQKVAAEDRFSEEKALIRSKIDGLLTKFEDFTEVQS